MIRIISIAAAANVIEETYDEHCAFLAALAQRHGLLADLRLALSVLTACASSGDDVSGAMQVTIKPGDTANGDSSPCQVSLKMPPGSGT